MFTKKDSQFILTLTVTASFGIMAMGKVQVESSISKFELSSCNPSSKRCISVHAAKAESGSLTPNMMLKNILVTIVDGKTKKEATYTQKTGFYDIENQRILLSQPTAHNTLEETVFSIKDVSVHKTEMK